MLYARMSTGNGHSWVNTQCVCVRFNLLCAHCPCVLYIGFRHFGLDKPYCSSKMEYPRNFTGETHKKYTTPQGHIDTGFEVFFENTHIYIQFKDILIFFNKFKIHDYVHMCTCSLLLYFKEQQSYNTIINEGRCE